jgi:hypothetical protein
MTHAGIVLAAGSGTRVGNSQNKVYLPLVGRRIVTWSLELFRKLPGIGRLVLVVRDEDRELAAEVLDRELPGAPVDLVTSARGDLLASTACATAVTRSPRICGTLLGLPRRRGPSRLDKPLRMLRRVIRHSVAFAPRPGVPIVARYRLRIDRSLVQFKKACG